MATVIGDAFVRILPQTAGFSSSLRRNLATGFTASEIEAQSFTRRIGSVIATGLATAAKVGTAALVGFGAFALASTGQLEQTLISFETILGSAEKGRDFMEDLFDFAARTPFEIPQLADAARRFLAVGFAADDVLVSLEAVATAGAAVGATSFNIDRVVLALGQMAGKGKVTAEELRQISDNFPGFSAIDAIAEGLGVTIPEAFAEVKAGAVSADEGIQLLLEGMRNVPGAATILERQSRTLLGVFSTLKDRVRQSVFEGMEEEVAGLADAMFAFIPVLGEFVSGLSTGIGQAVAQAVPVLTGLFEQFAKFAGPLTSTFFSVIFNLIRGLTPAVTTLADSMSGIIDVFGQLGVVAGTALAVFANIIANVAPLVVGIGDAVLGVVGIVERQLGPVFAAIADTVGEISSSIGQTLSAMFERLRPGLTDFLGAFRQLSVPIFEFGNAITGVLTSALPLILQLTQSVSDLYSGVAPLVEAIVGVIAQVLQSTSGLFAQLIPAALQVVDAILPLVQEAINSLVPVLEVIGEIVGVVGGALGELVPIIADLASALIAALAPAIDVIGDTLLQVLDVLKPFIEALATGIIETVEALAPHVGALAETFAQVVAAIAPLIPAALELAAAFLDPFIEILPQVGEIVGSIAESLGSALGDTLIQLADVAGVLLEALTPLISALGSGLAGTVLAVGAVLQAFAAIINAIPTPILTAVVALRLFATGFQVVLTALKSNLLAGVITFFGNLQAKLAAAAVQVQLFGANLQAANFAKTGGAVAGLGSAIAGVGKALPIIGTAAAVGIPIVMGLIQSAKARTEEWNREVQALADSMESFQGPLSEFLSGEAISSIDGLAEGLLDASVGADQFASALLTTNEAIGEFFGAADTSGELIPGLRDAGISLQAFGQAAAEGDNAVLDLFRDSGLTATQFDNLRSSFQDLDPTVRDSVDQLTDAALANLEVASASGQLTSAQQATFDALRAGEPTQQTAIGLFQQVKSGMQESAQAAIDAGGGYDEYTDSVREALDATSLFRDEVDRMNGNALDAAQAQATLAERFTNVRDAISQEGATFANLRPQFLDLAETIIDTSDALLDSGRARQGRTVFAQGRTDLLNLITSMGVARPQALEFVNEFLPALNTDTRARARFEVAEALTNAETLRNQYKDLPPNADTTARLNAFKAFETADQLERDLTHLHGRHADPTAGLRDQATTQLNHISNRLNEIDGRTARAAVVIDVSAHIQADANRFAALADINTAQGGIFDRETLRIIGEDGPEAVIPLTKPKRAMELLRQAGLVSTSVLSKPAGGNTAGLKITGGTTSPVSAAPRAPITVKLEIMTDGGDINPALYSRMETAVKAGVSDGIARAERIEDRW